MSSPFEQVDISMPNLPAEHGQFIEYLAAHKDQPMTELLEPYRTYDSELRKAFAQHPEHPSVSRPNIVPVFAGHEQQVKIRARDLSAESEKVRDCYIMPLKDEARRIDGSLAIAPSLRDFRTNFNVFSESALVDLDWSNVVAAGSAVVTPLMAIPPKHAGSKRALRDYYHEQFAPASDVDLFLYGLSEQEALEKIKQIERNVRDAILTETTTVRTKNAITIASQYPTRHIQIVLRIYKSISEILTGFDVDCSCAAYDGEQVYASPRALAAFMTQCNLIDLSRRSPSYENRLSKYARRGFEILWPGLDRLRIDPTIFERSFARTQGLARLLILERLPKSSDRDAYLDQRREERGRPSITSSLRNRRKLRGNIKDEYEDEVAEWVDAEDVSNYHTFTIPYGLEFHARKIEKLLYTKDLLMNSEWNLSKERREVNLHRHPAFFGRPEQVFHDCCGYCPEPTSEEDKVVAADEGKIYVSGDVTFIKDDPGRQSIGWFNPLTADDWTDMAYVGNTQLLCQAIVEDDSEYVRSWLLQEGNDPNTRDYTGRTPLHLAVASSSSETVQLLIDHGARLVARLVDGKTALHLAAIRGHLEILRALLQKSEANEEEEQRKNDARRALRKAEAGAASEDVRQIAQPSRSDKESDIDMVEDAHEDECIDATTENSIVNISPPGPGTTDMSLLQNETKEPDIYDINITAWDTAVSPLHLAIIKGHVEVAKCLVQEFGADILLPVKIFNPNSGAARDAILTLALALQLPGREAEEMVRTLIQLGASTAQGDLHQNTALQYCISTRADMLEILLEDDRAGVLRAINHVASEGSSRYHINTDTALKTAMAAKDSLTASRLLACGTKPIIDFKAFVSIAEAHVSNNGLPFENSKQKRQDFAKQIEQPVIDAVNFELPEVARELIETYDVDPNTLATQGWCAIHNVYARNYTNGQSLLDVVRSKVKLLREWTFENQIVRKPEPLKDDGEYLEGLREGTYVIWSARKQISVAKEVYAREFDRYERQIEATKDKTGLEEKQAAINKMADEYEQLEKTLMERGGKAFYEMHPDIENPQNHNRTYQRGTQLEKAFELDFSIQLPPITDEAQERYTELFEATWSGNPSRLKELTLLPWKDSDGETQPPLKVAVKDKLNVSPFAIALGRGNYELATVILEITEAQYSPPGQEETRRYKLDEGNDGAAEFDSSEGASDDDGDVVRVRSEVIDEQFTVETIGQVSLLVKSTTTPVNLITWSFPARDFVDGLPSTTSHLGRPRKQSADSVPANVAGLSHLSPEKGTTLSAPITLIQLALYKNDHKMLAYLLSMGNKYKKSGLTERDDDGAEAKRIFSVLGPDLNMAIRLDRPHLLAEMIKHTGAGIPIEYLVKHSDIEVSRSKYYRGLSVNGKKRRDWVLAGRNKTYRVPVENHRPLLLLAAFYGSLETVEWLLSDAPMRCYRQFAQANADDPIVKHLSEQKGGLEESVTRYLTARSHLALHCCVMGAQPPEAIRLLELLIKEMPHTIEAKSLEGLTPLQIAFRLHRRGAAKILIAAGADQTSRDNTGRNILHHLNSMDPADEEELANWRAMIELVDQRLLASLFLERSSEAPGSLTPLAACVLKTIQRYSPYGVEVLRHMLRYSPVEELNLINGEGHTPLHVAVRARHLPIATMILERAPMLLFRENATGRTPFEMAEDAELASMCRDPPPLPRERGYENWMSERYNLTFDWRQEITRRSAKNFILGVSERRQWETNRDKLWEFLQETKSRLEAQGLAKRSIVTLGEANEVARRLATKESTPSALLQPRLTGRARHRNRVNWENSTATGETSEEDADEVRVWMGEAMTFC